MFSSAYTPASTKSPTLQDWAKRVNTYEDKVEPAISNMQTRLGMGVTPIVLKNRELELAEQGAMMKETYNALSEAVKGIQISSNLQVIPYVSPLLEDETDEEENKKQTKTRPMVSKPSGNDFLEGE